MWSRINSFDFENRGESVGEIMAASLKMHFYC